jgi:hypothetical protein
MKKLTIPTAILASLLALSCTTTPSTAPAAAPKSEFKNLQVFPKDISREQLLTAMRGFTRGLGVRCDFCHVVTATEPKQQLDFPSDAKDEKRAARVMIQMVSQINGTWIPRVRAAKGEPAAEGTGPEGQNPRVSCWTCHRGKSEPEPPPPPPAQNAPH